MLVWGQIPNNWWREQIRGKWPHTQGTVVGTGRLLYYGQDSLDSCVFKPSVTSQTLATNPPFFLVAPLLPGVPGRCLNIVIICRRSKMVPEFNEHKWCR
jgi:hypothetical protein